MGTSANSVMSIGIVIVLASLVADAVHAYDTRSRHEYIQRDSKRSHALH